MAATFFELLTELCTRAGGSAPGRRVAREPSATEPWLHVIGGASIPAQGWKLHVSAGPPDAEAILRRAVPVLLAEGAGFKVAGSMDFLLRMNNGLYGQSQIGKFLTAYPPDDARAVRLAQRLDEATRGLRGPSIPSDRPLTPGSLVHYRYGGFQEHALRTASGQHVLAIRTPEGTLVPDPRHAAYAPPEWAADPFLAAGLSEPLPPPQPVIARRYLSVSTLYRSARGSVHLCLDLDTLRSCAVKRAPRYAQMLADGSDARDRLRREWALLERLAPHPAFPAPFELLEEEGELILAMELVEGETLDARVNALAEQGHLPLPGQVVAWGRALARALAAAHRAGVIHRDVKSSNIVITPDGGLKLIDFDVAHAPGMPLQGLGTRGYLSPQQQAAETPAVTDDVYSLGAVLYFATTGAEPTRAPRPLALLQRPVELLRPGTPPGLCALIASCLDAEPSRRPQSMDALDAALQALESRASWAAVAPGAENHPEEDTLRARYRELARRATESLCQSARGDSSGPPGWTSTYRGLLATPSSLYNGPPGVILSLLDLVTALGLDTHRALLDEALEGLRRLPVEEEAPALASLQMGDAGVAITLLRAGQLLERPTLITDALARAEKVATRPQLSPDFVVGAAGRAWSHLVLWDATREPGQLRAAMAAGEWLLQCAEAVDADACRWCIPPGFDELSGHAHPGYAHGAAGIADVMLELYEATGDTRFRETALRAFRWIARLAIPVLEDGSGRGWPLREGAPLFPFWCYGAPGIVPFLLHAAALDLAPEASALAEGAVLATARIGRWGAPTQCHGLAGNIETLLDAWQATGVPAWRSEAFSLARLLEAFAIDGEHGLAFSSDTPEVVTPDYMVGTSGVAQCLLRLAEPLRPRQLSRRGFRETARGK